MLLGYSTKLIPVSDSHSTHYGALGTFGAGINNGLLALTCPEAVAALNHGDRVEIDLEAGLIRTETGASFSFPPFAPSVQAIIADGGLIPHLQKQLGKGAS